MLCHPFKTIFVHVPKTGGQSIEMVFLGKLNLTWEQRASLLLRPNRDPAKGPPRLAHLYANEYVELGYVTPDTFAAYFKFAVVRNPWARLVSEYKYGYLKLPFKKFLSEVVGKRRGVLSERHIEPQVRYVNDRSGECLVDRLLRFESLKRDFAEVGRTIFGREEPLPVRNVSRDRRNYRTFYDGAARRFVAETYRDDIEAFGYEFDDG